MPIVASGAISFRNVAEEKGLALTNISLATISSTSLNTSDPTPRVPANTSSAAGNFPDTVAPHQLTEFYAYNNGFVTPTTTVATTTAATTTAATTTTTTATPTTTAATTTAATTTTTTAAPTTSTTTVPVTWNVTPSLSSVVLGDSITFTVNTTGVPDGTQFWFTTTVVSGTVNGDTFGPPDYQLYGGPFTITGGVGSFVRNIALVPAAGVFRIRIRTGHVGGTVVAETSNVTIGVATTTSTTTAATTTTTVAPIQVFYDYAPSCTTTLAEFRIFVNGLQTVTVSGPTPVSSSVYVTPGSTVYAIMTDKLDSECIDNSGNCEPFIQESGSYSAYVTQTLNCNSVGAVSPTRTLTSGQTLTYTVGDQP